MKKLFLYAVVTSFFFWPYFITHAQDMRDSPGCDVKTAGLDAAKFFIYFTQDTPYASWELWPGTGRLRRGKEPHGAFLTTYVNPVAHRSLAGKGEMAFGSLIVMENYDSVKRLIDLTVMIKIKGYNPQAGDWHWFKYASDGKVLATGRIAVCIDCHGAKKGVDYIMTAPVK